MGTTVNTFTCIEMLASNKIEEVTNATDQNRWASTTLGNNGYIFVTIVPSGSKLGWSTQTQHDKEKQKLIDKLRIVDPDLIIKEVTTSEG